jgi:hypothetical protein
MENLLYGLLSSTLNTLAMRFISKGDALYASIMAFTTTMVSILVLVNIVNTGGGAMWYALGVACGTFGAIKLEMKRGVQKHSSND